MELAACLQKKADTRASGHISLGGSLSSLLSVEQNRTMVESFRDLNRIFCPYDL